MVWDSWLQAISVIADKQQAMLYEGQQQQQQHPAITATTEASVLNFYPFSQLVLHKVEGIR